MAVLKAKRSNLCATHHRPRPPNPLPQPQLYDVLNHLNRGYGTGPVSLDNLELMNTANQAGILPA